MMNNNDPYHAPGLTKKQLTAIGLRLTNLLSGKRVDGDMIRAALNAASAEMQVDQAYRAGAICKASAIKAIISARRAANKSNKHQE